MTPARPGNVPRLLIDCDPGHDDAVMLVLAARHADVVGITTVSGNAPLDAVFAGTAGSVTLTSSITANLLKFETSGYSPSK